MNKPTPKPMYGVTFRDKNIRQNLINIQFDLWKETNQKHSMEEVMRILILNYKNKNQ